MRKKGGFTLIELIGALAIFMIAVSASFTAFGTSTELWKSGDIKLNTVTFNQTLAQLLRAEGKDTVKNINTMIDTNSDGTGYCYIYFNSYNEVNDDIDNRVLKSISNGTSASYQDCIDNNDGKKRYGALMQIIDNTGSNYYSMYKINVTVWDLKQPESYKAVSTFYVGR